MKIQIQLRDKEASIPAYATKGSVGFDLIANNFKAYYNTGNDIIENIPGNVACMHPRSRLHIGCGFKLAIPEGYELQIRPRSGLALKQGITVLNSPGTIDSDYRGEIGVVLINHSHNIVKITIGDKIAQAILSKIEIAEFELYKELNTTIRGEGGFGSTGK